MRSLRLGQWRRFGAGRCVETLAPGAWEDSLAEILSAAFYGAQAAGAQMLRQGRGVIVNVTSARAYQAIEGQAAYSAACAGLVALTKALGVEWAGRGVRVVGVATRPLPPSLDDAALAAYRRRTPLRAITTSEDLAQAVGFLVSDGLPSSSATLRVDAAGRPTICFEARRPPSLLPALPHKRRSDMTDSSFKAGAATVTITPPLGVELAGYGFGPNAGVLTELEAQALYIESGGVAVAIVSADLLAVGAEFMARLRQAAEAALGLLARTAGGGLAQPLYADGAAVGGGK
jgi:hypothetical protein